MEIFRNDIYMADLGNKAGSVQSGTRPVYIIQNNVGNKYSPTTIVAPVTSKLGKTKLPTHVEISQKMGLEYDSLVLCEQILTINQKSLYNKVCHIDNKFVIDKIDTALKTSLGLKF